MSGVGVSSVCSVDFVRLFLLDNIPCYDTPIVVQVLLAVTVRWMNNFTFQLTTIFPNEMIQLLQFP